LAPDLIALAYDPSSWAAVATLIVMEIVLGVDNLVFIAILSNKLPHPRSAQARRIGIGLSLIFRILLVGAAGFIVKLTTPLLTVFDHEFSWRDLILIAGGAFLVWKATTEIHHNVEADEDEGADPKHKPAGFAFVVAQIMLLDIVFSVDSIITAVGMTEHVPIMILAVIVAVLAMLLAADPLANFIHRNPTIVMLALGFLLLIGTTLMADGFGFHFPKGYIYAAMAFSGGVEALNILARSRRRVARPLSSPPLAAPSAPDQEPRLKQQSVRKRGQRRRRR
jgi:predicted tellurium resistance membrane protein TerC